MKVNKMINSVDALVNKLIRKHKPDTAMNTDMNASPGKFIVITGIGHCGTAWLANVLHRPRDGIVCYHEHKTRVTGVGWKEALKHEFEQGLDDLYDRYWLFMQDQLKYYQVVGDSNSWTMYTLSEVASKIEIYRVIYLVRNGIQNVHSAFYHNASIPRSDWLYTHFFRHYWELIAQPGGDWGEYSTWACWCFWWQLNNVMPVWLGDQLGSEKIVVYRFEDLLHDTQSLLNLLQQLHPSISVSQKQLRLAQRIDVNRKVQGNRSPEALWQKWTDEQQAIFKSICGPGMAKYEYPIPS